MRQLSDTFLQALKYGFLSVIVQKVIGDADLDLEIRDNYLNIYFKGNSLLRLTQASPLRYQVEIHPKFLGPMHISDLVDVETVQDFLNSIPSLKENIQIHGRSSVETEYEQMIIRANNYEPRNNSEYFIVDRQYASAAGRFDLTGLFWQRNKRRKGQVVPLCLIEIKYALNPDIQNLHEQLTRYYHAIQSDPENIVTEAQTVLKQKIELGLFNLPENRLEAMKTLTFSRDIRDFQFIVLLIDYNPHSSHLDLTKLAGLPFASQIRIFRSGFALWESNLKCPGELDDGSL